MQNEETKENESEFETVEIERVRPLYVNDTLIKADYDLICIDTPSGRIYFTMEELNGEINYGMYSGTTALDKELPKDEALEKAMSNRSWLDGQRNMEMRGHGGTFLHTCFANLAIEKSINLDLISERLATNFFDKKFYITRKEHAALVREISKDIVGISQWVRDYEVEFIAIELPVFSYELQMATRIDAWVILTITDGSGKNLTKWRGMALIDLKIGKWGHSIAHKYQLQAGHQMLVERYPEFANTEMRLFNLTGSNFRTTEWNRKTKPYKFTEQTNKIDMHDYNLTVAKAVNHMERRLNKKFMFMSGTMPIDGNPSDYIMHKTFKEIITSGDWKKFEAPEIKELV